MYYLYIAYNPQKLLQWFIRIHKIQKDKLEIGEKDNMKIEIGIECYVMYPACNRDVMNDSSQMP